MTPVCQVCGKEPAKYVCQKCGSLVCELDYVSEYELCSRCFEEEAAVLKARRQVSIDYPLVALGLGVLLIIAGMFLMMASVIMASWPVNATTGGVIVIGPIPFMFGAGEGLETILPILALIIIALILAQMILLRRRMP